MRLALVCFYCLCVFVYVLYFIATMSFAGYFLSVLFCLLSMLISDSRFDLVWFRLSCDHGWIRSGSVHVRKQQQQQHILQLRQCFQIHKINLVHNSIKFKERCHLKGENGHTGPFTSFPIKSGSPRSSMTELGSGLGLRLGLVDLWLAGLGLFALEYVNSDIRRFDRNKQTWAHYGKGDEASSTSCSRNVS